MPKEGPKDNEMSRREFLRTAGTIAGGLALSPLVATEKVRGQEANAPLYDLSKNEIYFNASKTKINYPETPEAMSKEVENLILAIREYDSFRFQPMEVDGKIQLGHFNRTDESLVPFQSKIYTMLKTLDPALPEFTEENFFRALVTSLPQLLAKYGVLPRMDILPYPDLQPGKPANTHRAEYRIDFLEINNVSHTTVEQWREKAKEDVIYIKGPLVINGQKMINGVAMIDRAWNIYGNVFLYEDLARQEYDGVIVNNIKTWKEEEEKYGGKEKLVQIFQKQLEQLNDLTTAIDFVTAKAFKRESNTITFEEFKQEILIHETRHFLDLPNLDLTEHFRTKGSLQDFMLRNANVFGHMELTPQIAQLRYAPARRNCFLKFMNEVKIESKNTNQKDRKFSWILSRIVELIALDPGKYGIKLDKSSLITLDKQIISQMDKLLEHPEVFDDLMDRVFEIHKTRWKDDLSVGYSVGPIASPGSKTSETLIKVGVPATVAVGVGALAYGVKKIIDRRNAGLSRQQKKRRATEKTKKQKK